MILSCDRLTVSYDDIVIQDVSFTVEKGDFICIVGENGSGKTTLCKALLQLLPIKSGTVSTKNGLRFGYVPQKLSLRPHFPASVLEIVRSGIQKRGPFLSRADKERVENNMRLLGIDKLRKKSFQELSGGQQQRVLIARALTASDGVLLLDEPTGGLDPLAQSDLYALLRDLNRQAGMTILMVSHDVHAAVRVANKILHIDKTVKYFGAPEGFMCSECGKRFLGGEADA